LLTCAADLGGHCDRGSGPEGKTNAGLSAVKGQRKARAALVDEGKREASTLAAGNARAAVTTKGRQIETEAASIRYVAAVFGVTDRETSPAADRAHGVVL
jgi:hypothetical protein